MSKTRYNDDAVHRPTAILACVLIATATTGCVRRTISISSDPAGALVYLNDREVGRTPLDVEFLYYGTYDVRLVKEGFEPLVTSGKASAPLWDTIPFDFAAELVPGEPHSRVTWHYDLQPADNDPIKLAERAREMREKIAPME